MYYYQKHRNISLPHLIDVIKKNEPNQLVESIVVDQSRDVKDPRLKAIGKTRFYKSLTCKSVSIQKTLPSEVEKVG